MIAAGWWWGGCALMMVVMMVMMIPMMGRSHGHSGHSETGWNDDPERTLADRLARGEIDTEEYEASIVGMAVAAFGGWPGVTGATVVCPLYVPLGITTLPKMQEVPSIERSKQAASGRNLSGRVPTTTTGSRLRRRWSRAQPATPPRWRARSRSSKSASGSATSRSPATGACSPRPASATISSRQSWTGSPPLRGPAIAALISQGAIQPTLFDNQDMAEITSRTTRAGG
jgi:hypothetical protein